LRRITEALLKGSELEAATLILRRSFWKMQNDVSPELPITAEEPLISIRRLI
jgi:hypothetical protein